MSKKRRDPPEKIQINEMELLKLENLRLKLRDVESMRTQLIAEHTQLVSRVQARLGIDDISKYAIDVKTGTGRRMRPADEKPAADAAP